MSGKEKTESVIGKLGSIEPMSSSSLDWGVDLTKGWWELNGPRLACEFFAVLRDWLPPGSFLCFQEGSTDAEIKEFFARRSIAGPVHCGDGAHIPATEDALDELIHLMDHHAEPELAIHVHVYRDGWTFLEWFDAFFDMPMRLDIEIPEERIKLLAGRFGTEYSREHY